MLSGKQFRSSILFNLTNYIKLVQWNFIMRKVGISARTNQLFNFVLATHTCEHSPKAPFRNLLLCFPKFGDNVIVLAYDNDYATIH